MHFVVSYDITNRANNNRAEWEERIREVIQTYSWVRPLTTFFVIQVADAYHRQIIVDGLTRVSNAALGDIHFVATPLMAGGLYGGVLPGNLWPELNARSR